MRERTFLVYSSINTSHSSLLPGDSSEACTRGNLELEVGRTPLKLAVEAASTADMGSLG